MRLNCSHGKARSHSLTFRASERIAGAGATVHKRASTAK